MLDKFGWLGSAAFAISSAPQAYKSYREGHSVGVSWGLINLSLIGEICSIVYILPKSLYPLLINYISNLFFLSIVLYYKLRPRDGK